MKNCINRLGIRAFLLTQFLHLNWFFSNKCNTETCLCFMITKGKLKVNAPEIIPPFFFEPPNMEFCMEANYCNLLKCAIFYLLNHGSLDLGCFGCTIHYRRCTFKWGVQIQIAKQQEIQIILNTLLFLPLSCYHLLLVYSLIHCPFIQLRRISVHWQFSW